jgi:hypothetical protein
VGYVVSLNDNVGHSHVDMIKFPQRSGAIHYYVGNDVNGTP